MTILDASAMMHWYLYGQESLPTDLTDSSLIRPTSDEKLVVVDTQSYMNKVGRFALPSQFELIQSFFASSNIPIKYDAAGNITYYTKTELNNEIFELDQIWLKVNQYEYTDGMDDYAERTLVWNTGAFVISEDAKFWVEADGTRHIEDLAILPLQTENFDLESSDIPTQIANLAYLHSRIDPGDLGRKVIVDYAGDVVTRDYSSTDYLADNNTYNSWGRPSPSYALSAISALLTDLSASNDISPFDAEGRPIIYGTNEADVLYDTTSAYPFYSGKAGGGIAFVGGGGDDTLIGTSGNDYFEGGDGNDTADYKGFLKPISIEIDVTTGEPEIVISGTGSGQDHLHSVESIEGTVGRDTLSLKGDIPAGFHLRVDAGTGQSGEDVLLSKSASSAIIVSLANGEGYLRSKATNGQIDLVGFTSVAASDHDDEITVGGGQRQTISAGGGSDIVVIGAGKAIIDAGSGDDVVHGGDDADVITGGEGANTIAGGAGSDRIISSSVGDEVQGGEGADYLEARGSAGVLSGGAGNDVVDGRRGMVDTYKFARGDGHDTVLTAGSIGLIDLSTLSSSEVEFIWDATIVSKGTWNHTNTHEYWTFDGLAGDLAIVIKGTGESILIKNVSGSQVYWFEDGDGLVGGQKFRVEFNVLPSVLLSDTNNAAYGSSDLTWGSSFGFGFAEQDFRVVEVKLGSVSQYGGAESEYAAGAADGMDTSGTGGSDNLSGGGGDDNISAGGGDDHIFASGGSDIVDGGAGDDTINFFGERGAFTIFKENGQIVVEDRNGLEGTVRLTSVEHLSFASDGRTFTATEIEAAFGTEGDDQIVGGLWDETLQGQAGDDILTGGAGKDSLSGGVGADTYHYNPGDGDDVIIEEASDSGVDTLRLGAGLTPADVLASADLDSSDVVISFLGQAGSIRLVNQAVGGGVGIERIVFDDGTVWSAEDIAANTALQGGGVSILTGTTGNDVLQGNWWSDVLRGEAGNDTLVGGKGGDTYVYTSGGGNDLIVEGGFDVGAIDTLQLSDLNAADVTFSRDGDDLVVSDHATNQQIRVTDQFESGLYRIEQVRFADGTYFGEDDFDQAFLPITNLAPIATSGRISYGSVQERALTSGEMAMDVASGSTSFTDPDVSDVHSATVKSVAVSINANGASLQLPRQTMLNWLTVSSVVEQNGASAGLVNWTFSAPDKEFDGLGALEVSTLTYGLTISDGQGGTLYQQVVVTITGAEDAPIIAGPQSVTATSGVSVLLDSLSISDPDLGDVQSMTVSAQVGLLSLTASPDLVVAGSGTGTLTISGGVEAINAGLASLAYVSNSPGADTLTVVVSDGTLSEARSINVTVSEPVLNQILGTGANDSLYGSSADETLVGGLGDDYLVGRDGSDTYIYASGDGNDVIFDENFTTGGIETLKLVDLDPDDITLRRDGYHLYVRDNTTGHEIQVQYQYHPPYDQGIEQIQFADRTIWDSAELSRRSLLGGGGNDLIDGDDYANVLSGAGGNDTLYGRGGNDILIGGTGNDTLSGMLGDDVYRYELGDGDDVVRDEVYGVGAGSGNDTLAFGVGIAAGDVTVTKSGGGQDLLLSIAGGGSVTLLGALNGYESYRIEQVTFTDGTTWDSAELLRLASLPGDGDDLLDGDDNANTLSGGGGNDTIYGRGGNDILIGGTGNDTLSGMLGDDTYRYELGDGNDIIRDEVYGVGAGNGNDTVAFGAGVAASDVTVTKSGGGQDLLLSIAGGGSVTLLGALNGYESYRIEQVTFTDGTTWDSAELLRRSNLPGEGDDLLDGDDNANMLSGGGGNDTIYGRGGNDILIGGTGNDTLSGMTGNDIYRYERGDGNDIVRDELYGVGAGSGNDTVEFGTGVTPGDVTVTKSGGGQDLLLSIAGGGSVTLYGALNGYESYRIEQVTFTDGTIWDSAELLRRSNVSSDGDDVLDGDDSANTLSGGGGSDTIYGRGGNDVLIGGVGADTLYGGSGNDTFIYNLGDGQDSIYESDYSGSSDMLSFGAGITANDIVVTSVVGTSDLIISFVSQPGSVRLVNQNAGYYYGIEEVTFVDGVSLSQADLILRATTGTPGDDVLTGDQQANTISGGSGDDVIRGQGGNDTLTGGTGNDMLYGGIGNDTFFYNLGDGDDTIYESDYSGDADKLSFGAGISANDLIVTSVAGTSDLNIGFAGQAGSIRLVNQTSGYNYGIEQVTFTDGSSLTQADLILRATSGTSGDDVLTGDQQANSISGGAGNDVLRGEGGNDILTGGTGTDTLYGGAGNDTYVYNLGDGNDSIYESDWSGDADTLSFGAGIDADDLVVTSTPGITDLTISFVGQAGSIHLINQNGDYQYGVERVIFADGSSLTQTDLVTRATAGTSGDDVLIGGPQTNAISGGAGNDVIRGEGGNDVLNGGTGTDTLYGGAGNDAFVYNLGDGSDTIYESDWSGDADTLLFGAGIDADDLVVTSTPGTSDLTITFVGDAGSIRLVNQTSGYQYGIEQFSFYDGSTLNGSDLIALM